MNPFSVLAKRMAAMRRRAQVMREVANLSVQHSGLTDDGVPFVKLHDGFIFHGNATPAWGAKHYRRMPDAVRKTLTLEALQVACDIVIRYREGGLKSGGPRKESRYTPTSGDTVAEMGAYQGFFTMRLAKQVGETGHIVAIEPVADNAAMMRRNVEANGLTQVAVVEKGVWSEQGSLRFAQRRGDGQSASVLLSYAREDEHTIPVDSLDHILADAGADKVDLMIVQLNGAEREALIGLTSVRPRHLAIAARYMDDQGPTAPRIIQLLESRGYRVEAEAGGFLFAEG